MPETPADLLPVGTSDAGIAHLLARRFNRHTFWCGQSGSGKTYALGVLLEQLLLQTHLPLVVFDPNGDFVRMRELRENSPAEAANVLRGRDIRVLRPNADGDDRLTVRFVDLPMHSKAAMLRLDPLIDLHEFNSMLHLEEEFSLDDPAGILSQLRGSSEKPNHVLADRIENLGLLDWQVWARGSKAATDVIDERPDATVLDLGGFGYAEEPLVVALAVLEHLWAHREERKPVLLVIDEAHNLCSPDLQSPLGRAVREQIIRIAAEGRKYGLWLLLSTQRPSKVHRGIISQCDNLALMKMGSPADLAELASIFGFVPESLLMQAPLFQQGQALFGGGFIASPAIVQMGERMTEEGGTDVRVPLR